MKKIILIIALAFGCYVANAQTTDTKQDTTHHKKGYNDGDYTDPQTHGDNFGNYGTKKNTAAPANNTQKSTKQAPAKNGNTNKAGTTSTSTKAPAKKPGTATGAAKSPASKADTTKSHKPKQ